MVNIKSINLETNEVTFDKDNPGLKEFDTLNHDQFYNKFVEHWSQRIAGETLSPVHMERFMKRTSTKNTENLIRGKKVEGYMEGRFGKKMDPAWIKMILIIAIVGFVGLLGVFIMQKMGLL